jgi:PilZ domain-containing protein
VDQRLQEDTRVTINLPPRDARARLRDFDATVVALLDAAVVLRPVEIDFDLIPGRTEDVFLSFVAGRGLVALKGALTRDGGGVRFTVQDGVRVRRRRATRIDVELPITLNGALSTTANLSCDGALVRCELAVALEERVDVALTLPHAELKLRARVVRHGDGLVALEFVDGARAALADFIAHRA